MNINNNNAMRISIKDGRSCQAEKNAFDKMEETKLPQRNNSEQQTSESRLVNGLVNVHDASIDSKMQLYKCRFCTLCFTLESELNRHLLVHIHPQYILPSGCKNCGSIPCKCAVNISKQTEDLSTPSNYNRSADLSLTKLNDRDRLAIENDTSESTTLDNHKYVYKPKFRASYSVDECQSRNDFSTHLVTASTSKMSTSVNNENSTSMNPFQSSSQYPQTDVVHSGASSQVVCSDRRQRSPSTFTVWKSTSPDLGERIDKIIVQNQEIMNHDNPLLGRKFRRQSSLGANEEKRKHNSGDKNRNIPNQCTRMPDNRSSSVIPVESHPPPIKNIKRGSSVPAHKSSFSNSVSVTTITPEYNQIESETDYVTSGKNINSLDNTVLRHHLQIQPDSEVNQIILTKGQSLALQGTSIVPVPHPRTISNFPLVYECRSCNLKFKSKENLTSHIVNDGCNKVNKFFGDSLEALRTNENEREKIPYDVQDGTLIKRSPFPQNFRASSLGVDLSSHHQAVRVNKSLSPFTRHHSIEPILPPNKKRKLSTDLHENISNYNFNGVSIQNCVKLKTIEEKPKSISQLCGGEVKICDDNGRDYKTMKIDSNDCKRSIAYEIYINKPDEEEPNTSSSVYVTLSTSGLNCGGTVVQSKRSKLDTASTYTSSSNLCSSIVERGNIKSNLPFNSDVNAPQIPFSSLHKYAPQLQLPNLAIPGVPTPNITGHFSRNSSLMNGFSKPKLLLTSAKRNTLDSNRPANYSSKLLHVEKPIVPSSILSGGKERVPFIPGIPGPYSQSSPSFEQSSTSVIAKDGIGQNFKTNQLKDDEKSLNSNELLNNGTTDLTESYESAKEIVPIILLSTKADEQSTDRIPKTESLSPDNLNKEDDFLVPRQRPNSLALKPQQFVSKSSAFSIGSVIMSPDTPRPRKSCAQLLLDGSAYTYLGLKVSTKVYYCCIYRPQCMYVLQSPDSKLSMYSNWQLRKPAENNLFDLSISKLMGLYSSRSYTNRAYSIAKHPTDMIYINSYDKLKPSKLTIEDNNKEDALIDVVSVTDDNNEDNKPISNDEEHPCKRIKIFDGGFKSTEDYTYVRGRGRGRYVCETCGIRCKKPSMLKKHIRTHTNLRPYPCGHCTTRFKTKGNLTKHLKSKAHHKRCIQLGIISEMPQGFEDGGSEEEEEEDDCDDDFDEDDDEDLDVEDRESSSRSRENSADITSHEDSPIDLSVRKTSFNTSVSRPTFLPLPGTSSVGGNIMSPHTPLTPIREQVCDILSPVTDSSMLLKSIYSTTERASRASPLIKSDEERAPMMKAYLTERAIQDCSIKQHQFQTNQIPKSMNGDCKNKVTYSYHSGNLSAEEAKSSVHTKAQKIPNSSSLLIKPKSYYSDKWLGSKEATSTIGHNSRSDEHFDSEKFIKKSAREKLDLREICYIREMRDITDMDTTPSKLSNSIPSILYKKITEPLTDSATKSSQSTSITMKDVELLDKAKCNIGNSSTMHSLLESKFKCGEESVKTEEDKLNEVEEVKQLEINNETIKDKPNKLLVTNDADTTEKEQRGSKFIDKLKLKTDSHECSKLIKENKFHKLDPSCYSITTTTAPLTSISTSSTVLISSTVCGTSLPTPSISASNVLKKLPDSSGTTAATSSVQLTQKDAKTTVSGATFTSAAVNAAIITNALSSKISSSLTSGESSSSQSSYVSSMTKLTNPTVMTFSDARVGGKGRTAVMGPKGSYICELSSGGRASAGSSSAMNLTVLNTVNSNGGPSFLSPSGVMPSNSDSLVPDGPRRCFFCHREFSRVAHLNLHINIHYMERPFRCQACAVSFRSIGHLQKHNRSATHFNKVNMNQTFGAASTDNPRPFKCHECKVAFRIHGHLAKHLRSKMHVLKLECLGKLPFGLYAEMERTGFSFNAIDTTDCENSLLSLQSLATKIFSSEPNKILAWQNGEDNTRVRTISNSSANSEEYPMGDDQDDPQTQDSGDETDCPQQSEDFQSSTLNSSPSTSSSGILSSSSTSSPSVTTTSNSSKEPNPNHAARQFNVRTESTDNPDCKSDSL